MKILLIAPCSKPYQHGSFMLKYLTGMGHEVCAFDYRQHPPTALGRWPLVSNHWIYPVLLRSLPVKNRLLIRQALDFKPELILVVKGESVLPQTIEYLKQHTGALAINWFPDDPHLFNAVARHNANAYDVIFTSSADAVAWYKELGIKRVHWLGFACDPEIHKQLELTPEEQTQYESEICFVGTYYPERQRILKQLADFKLKFWGPHWYRPLIGNKLYKHYMGSAIYHQDMVKAYNAAKIVINIHPAVMRHKGLRANMKAYEIAGSGAFQLCDKTKGLEEVFAIGDEIACYQDEHDVAAVVRHYLKRPEERDKIARAAQQRAYNEYTFQHRLTRILAEVG